MSGAHRIRVKCGFWRTQTCSNLKSCEQPFLKRRSVRPALRLRAAILNGSETVTVAVTVLPLQSPSPGTLLSPGDVRTLRASQLRQDGYRAARCRRRAQRPRAGRCVLIDERRLSCLYRCWSKKTSISYHSSSWLSRTCVKRRLFRTLATDCRKALLSPAAPSPN